jgi:hypothetical protein
MYGGKYAKVQLPPTSVSGVYLPSRLWSMATSSGLFVLPLTERMFVVRVDYSHFTTRGDRTNPDVND